MQVSQGCGPRESLCSRLKVIGQEGLTLQMESKGSQLDNSLLFRRRWGFAVVVVFGRSRPSTDGTRPTHIMESDLPYSSPPIQVLSSPKNTLTGAPGWLHG